MTTERELIEQIQSELTKLILQWEEFNSANETVSFHIQCTKALDALLESAKELKSAFSTVSKDESAQLQSKLKSNVNQLTTEEAHLKELIENYKLHQQKVLGFARKLNSLLTNFTFTLSENIHPTVNTIATALNDYRSKVSFLDYKQQLYRIDDVVEEEKSIKVGITDETIGKIVDRVNKIKNANESLANELDKFSPWLKIFKRYQEILLGHIAKEANSTPTTPRVFAVTPEETSTSEQALSSSSPITPRSLHLPLDTMSLREESPQTSNRSRALTLGLLGAFFHRESPRTHKSDPNITSPRATMQTQSEVTSPRNQSMAKLKDSSANTNSPRKLNPDHSLAQQLPKDVLKEFQTKVNPGKEESGNNSPRPL